MLKPEFAKALDLIKLRIILQAINMEKRKYITSSDIAELTELFGRRGVLSPSDVRRTLNKFNIKAESNKEGYKVSKLVAKIFRTLEDNDFLDWII